MANKVEIKDFYGRVVASGDQLAMLLNAEK